MATTFKSADGSMMYERLTWPIYSSAALATGATSAVFFTVPLGGGSSVWNATGPATLEDTNMTVAGSLPAGYTHHTKGVSIQFQPNISVIDAKAILKGGALQLKIAAKDQLQGPIIMFPGGSGIDGAIGTQTAAATNEFAHSGIADPRSIFPLDNEVTILPNQNISCRIDWGTGPTLSATQPIRLVFWGWLDRPVQ